MRVAQLYVYPVKGCRALAVDQATLGPLGFEHDRSFAFVGADGRAVTQRDSRCWPRFAQPSMRVFCASISAD
jgi:uncharacterized protein YcbX